MIGFTTANRISMKGAPLCGIQIVQEDLLDIPFRAAAEATEGAVLNSLAAAHTVTGCGGLTIYALGRFSFAHQQTDLSSGLCDGLPHRKAVFLDKFRMLGKFPGATVPTRYGYCI